MRKKYGCKTFLEISYGTDKYYMVSVKIECVYNTQKKNKENKEDLVLSAKIIEMINLYKHNLDILDSFSDEKKDAFAILYT